MGNYKLTQGAQTNLIRIQQYGVRNFGEALQHHEPNVKMKRDMYQTYIGAKGVAFVWIGAALGSCFFIIGLNADSRAHLIVGIVSFILLIVSLFDGIKAFKARSWSDVFAFAIVPISLLIAGIAFVILEG